MVSLASLISRQQIVLPQSYEEVVHFQFVFEGTQPLHSPVASLLPMGEIVPVDIYISHHLEGIYAGNSSTEDV